MAYKQIRPIVVSEGGTGNTTLTIHGVLIGNSTSAITQLAAATTGSALMGVTGADPAFTGSPSFTGSVTAGTTLTATSGNITASSGTLVVSSPVTVANGGTGLATLTAHSLQVGAGTSTPTQLAVGTTGTVLTGVTGADPAFATLSGIAVTSISGTANQITASASTGAVTLSTPSTFIAPGSIESTTSITADNGFTVTTGTVSINSGTSTLGISTDATNTAVSIATGAGVKTAIFGSTNSTSVTTVNCGTGGAAFGTSANSHITSLGSATGTSSTSVDCGTGGATLASTANDHTTTIGSATGASSMTLNCGTSGMSIGVNANSHPITLGSTTGTSTTTIQSGSGNVTINSGLTIDSSGRNKNTTQPSFLAIRSATTGGVTGDGTAYTVIYDTVIYNQGSSYNNSTGVFTAPVTGKYLFCASVYITGLTTLTTRSQIVGIGTSRFVIIQDENPFAIDFTGGDLFRGGTFFLDMTANDTLSIRWTVFGAATKVAAAFGDNLNEYSYFSGALIC